MPSSRKQAVKVTPLTTICIRVLAENFKNFSVAHKVNDKHRAQLLETLPLDVDIDTAGTHIHDETYWEKRCRANERWTYFQLAEHGFTWKQLFFEKNLQDRLHDFGKGDDHLALIEDIKSSSDFVHSLNIEQLQSHLNLEDLFEHLANLSHLSLTYGAKKLRMNFKRELFGMKFSDAETYVSYRLNIRLVSDKPQLRTIVAVGLDCLCAMLVPEPTFLFSAVCIVCIAIAISNKHISRFVCLVAHFKLFRDRCGWIPTSLTHTTRSAMN